MTLFDSPDDGAENILFASDQDIVCWCSGVTKGEILEAKRLGARTLGDIRTLTGACTKGRCREFHPRGR